jgi:hypothetical protein
LFILFNFITEASKIVQLDSHKLLVGSGVYADSVNFNEYVQKNMKLYELNNDLQLSTDAAANFIRGEVVLVPLFAIHLNSCSLQLLFAKDLIRQILC